MRSEEPTRLPQKSGWCDDPEGAGQWRWWTGSEWYGKPRPRPRAIGRVRPRWAWASVAALFTTACILWVIGAWQNLGFWGDQRNDGDTEQALAWGLVAVAVFVSGYASVLSYIRGYPPVPEDYP